MKKEISSTNSRKIGLFSAISMLIGSVVGVGIFFKNSSVFQFNDFNSIGILISWILSALICLCTAFSFAEVSTSDQSKSGLGGWCFKLVGKKFGNFVQRTQPVFYFSIISLSVTIFSSEAIFNIFGEKGSNVHFGVVLFIGLLIFIMLNIFNFLSIKYSNKFQKMILFFKFVPLIFVIFSGIIYGSLNPSDILFNNDKFPQDVSATSFTNILISVPSILFAFDSFTNVGNLSKDILKPKKNIPLAIIIGMITVTILYLAITVAQILVGPFGNVYEMFDKITAGNQTAQVAVKITISVLIMISIFGVSNVMCLITLRSYQSIVDDKLIIKNNKISRFSNNLFNNRENSSGFLLSNIFYFIFWILLMIPSVIFNTDAYIDGISNFPTTLFFAIYATVILFGLINRKTNKVQVNKMKGFTFFGIIAVLGCYFVSFFQFIYTFFIRTIIEPDTLISWGLFFKSGYEMHQWQSTIVFISYIFSLIIYNCINVTRKIPTNSFKNIMLDLNFKKIIMDYGSKYD